MNYILNLKVKDEEGAFDEPPQIARSEHGLILSKVKGVKQRGFFTPSDIFDFLEKDQVTFNALKL